MIVFPCVLTTTCGDVVKPHWPVRVHYYPGAPSKAKGRGLQAEQRSICIANCRDLAGRSKKYKHEIVKVERQGKDTTNKFRHPLAYTACRTTLCKCVLKPVSTQQCHAVLGRLCPQRPQFQAESCGADSLAGLPCESPSPAQVTTTLSDGAQNTSSPASWGQASGPGSAPAHANSLTPGATSPQAPPGNRKQNKTMITDGAHGLQLREGEGQVGQDETHITRDTIL